MEINKLINEALGKMDDKNYQDDFKKYTILLSRKCGKTEYTKILAEYMAQYILEEMHRRHRK